MRVKVTRVAAGPGPSEEVVAIKADEGSEEVVVYSRSLRDDSLPVGAIRRRNGSWLVELPRETLSGKWRLWVPRSELLDEMVEA
jgi:hypothetical protein